MLSITLSTRKAFSISPNSENRPVLMSKIKQADSAIRESLTSSALPVSSVEYFFRIIATTSVPPVEAPVLKSMAEPTAGSSMAKNSSSSG